MSFDQLMQLLFGQLGTQLGGWDAVCAMNTDSVNALLFQQFLTADPSAPSRSIQTLVYADDNYFLLEVWLGPPSISFQTTGAVIQMDLVSASLATIDATAASPSIVSVVQLPPDSAFLTGTVSLSAVQGTVTEPGQVLATVPAGAWTAEAFVGIDASAATQLQQALQDYLSTNPVQYQLGSVAQSNVPPCLTPTAFSVAMQPGSGSDGCVLILIQTTGSGGPIGPLSFYPIPDGYTASLFISTQVIFAELILASLAQQLPTITFGASSDSWGDWVVAGTGGSLNIGVIQPEGSTLPASCSATSTTAAPVSISGVGFAACGFYPADQNPPIGQIQIGWLNDWNQYWAYTGDFGETTSDSIGMQVTYSANGQATVSANNEIALSIVDPTVAVITTSGPSWWEKNIEGYFDATDAVQTAIQTTIQNGIGSLQLPDISTFSLLNLLFPALNAITLQQAAVPRDLMSAGIMQALFSVTPATSSVQPGATVQFSAADSQGTPLVVNWELSGFGQGSIDTNGLYTAPTTISHPEIVVVTAVNSANTDQTASAMVIVTNAASVQVSPPSVTLMPGDSYSFQVTDSDGNPIAATYALDPNEGTIQQGSNPGQFTYVAPTSQVNVTLTAATSAGSGTATINVATTTSISVTPSSPNIAGLGTTTITTNASSVGESTLQWAVYPAGTGTVTPNPLDSTQATYTAPASIGGPVGVDIVAFNLDDMVWGKTQVIVAASS
jgi:plastocyanin